MLHLPSACPTDEFVDSMMEDILEDIIHDIGAESFAEALVYENMSTNVETLLYVGSTNFALLSTILRLTNLKGMNGWMIKSSQNCFNC